jgi:DNA invertase Pin-like site-specific DNA recombinase
LVSVMEPDLCQDDPSRKLMRQIFGAIAEYEKTMIVLKLRGARARKRATDGRCEGAKPYGQLAGETTVIGRMHALRASGLGFEKVAAQLNAEGIKPRRGAKWYGKTVDKILSANPRQAAA